MTIWGTAHFVSLSHAVDYYRPYGFTALDVERKRAAGEIHIGPPSYPDDPRAKVILIDGGRRYGVEVS